MSEFAIQLVDLCDLGDGEPRIKDLRIAERLEFERSRNIRELIERNSEELKRYGGLPCHRANPGPLGGRPSEEYFLNEPQALLICMRSETPRAADVREELIRVFVAYRHGYLVPKSPVTLEAIGDLFDAKLAPVRADISDIQGNVIFLANRIDDMVPRRDFTKETQKQWAWICIKLYGCRCPCCNKEVIIDKDGSPISRIFNADHFNGRELTSPQDGWPVCFRCNSRLKDASFKQSKRHHFQVFQDHLRELLNPVKKITRTRYFADPNQGVFKL